MRLAEFIVENMEPILAEWEKFARSLTPGTKMTKLALRDDAEAMLRATARDMQKAQSLQQQASKSKGTGGAGGTESDGLDNASALHGVARVNSAFDIMEVVSEYRALRASVLRLWRESLPQADLNDIDDITRFDESLDQSLAQAVGSYSQRVDQSRRMFLAILSHDLRTPLACIRMAAHGVSRKKDDPDAVKATSMIERNADAMMRLISDLSDFAANSLGRSMPMKRGPVDLEILCREVVDGYRTTHPGRTLRFHSDGDLTGMWDAARLRQIISNLMSNAIQHGSPQGPIDLSVALEGSALEGSASEGSTPEQSTAKASTPDRSTLNSSTPQGSTVVLRVHNEGVPIPAELLPTIFDPLMRYDTADSAARPSAGSIGLGLHIVRDIVAAKGGTVQVTSTADEGTTFTIRIPRFLPAEVPAEVDKPDDANAANPA